MHFVVCSSNRNRMSNRNSTSIVIIGAGAAGLSAAKKLLEHGFENVQILEAESRIGGRIYSIYLGDNFIDLGARWCHGEKGNIVFSTVKDYDVLDDTTFPEIIFHSSGFSIDEEFSKELWEIFNSVYSTDADYPAEYETFGDYCTKEYIRIIEEKYNTKEEKLRIARDALDFFELEVLCIEGSSNWYDSTAQSDYRECEGNQLLNWKGKGFKTFIEVLLEKYPNAKIISDVEKIINFNKEVKKIIWNSQEKRAGIKIICSDSSDILADHVIVTVSLGVLKENLETIFDPKLPTEKKEAIEDMGFGSVMKVALYYSQKWWPNDCYGFSFIWSAEDRKKALEEFSEGPKLNNRSWVTYIPYVIQADNNPNVFMVWFVGPLVEGIELLSKETLTKGINYVLRKFVGHIYNIHDPDKIVPSTWNSNPHFRGTYSYQTVKAKRGSNSTNAQENLAVPIKNCDQRPFVHFAGEGTSASHYSNVQGAVESGFREADVIIGYYRDKNE